MIPIVPSEWAQVGLDSDVKCFNLMKFLYGAPDMLLRDKEFCGQAILK